MLKWAPKYTYVSPSKVYVYGTPLYVDRLHVLGDTLGLRCPAGDSLVHQSRFTERRVKNGTEGFSQSMSSPFSPGSARSKDLLVWLAEITCDYPVIDGNITCQVLFFESISPFPNSFQGQLLKRFCVHHPVRRITETSANKIRLKKKTKRGLFKVKKARKGNSIHETKPWKALSQSKWNRQWGKK